jgi:hypothetical protein
MTQPVALLIGTPKGAFIIDGDAGRRTWKVRGPLCEGWPIHDISVQPGTGALLAGGGSPWYGGAVWRSDDLGATWSHSSEGMTYGDDDKKIEAIGTWRRRARSMRGSSRRGFRSDGGRTGARCRLTNHPTRPGGSPETAA